MSQTKYSNIFRYLVDSRQCRDSFSYLIKKSKRCKCPSQEKATIINGNFRILEGVLSFYIHYTHSLVPSVCSHSVYNSLCELERFSVPNISGTSGAPFNMTWRLLGNHTPVLQSSNQKVMHKRPIFDVFDWPDEIFFKRVYSFWCQQGISSN